MNHLFRDEEEIWRNEDGVLQQDIENTKDVNNVKVIRKMKKILMCSWLEKNSENYWDI